MAIGFVGVSANAAAASGDITINPPVTSTDDIMICAVSTHDNVAVTFPGGWTIYQQANNTTALRATLAWKRCVGAEAGFVVTHTAGDGIVGNVIVFSGCLKSASPINASVLTANGSSSTCTAATITSTVNGCMLVFTMHDSDNGASSAQSSANLGAMTERFDNASTLGLDEAVSAAHVSQTSAGASGSSTGTLSLGPDVNSGGNTFLEPEPFSGGYFPKVSITPAQRYEADSTLRDPRTRPRYIDVPFGEHVPEEPAAPVIPFVMGQWRGDAVKPITGAIARHLPFPYWQEPPPPPNPVIPVRTVPAWWSHPPKGSHAHHYAKHELPRYFPLILFQTAWGDYESFLQFDLSKYTAPTVIFEVIMRADSGEASARVFNVTDGVEVAGSALATSSSTFVRLRSAALTLSGAKEYKAQARLVGSMTIMAARLIVQQ